MKLTCFRSLTLIVPPVLVRWVFSKSIPKYSVSLDLYIINIRTRNEIHLPIHYIFHIFFSPKGVGVGLFHLPVSTANRCDDNLNLIRAFLYFGTLIMFNSNMTLTFFP